MLNLTTRDIQIRLNAKKLADPLLVVDGMMGPKTRRAITQAKERQNVSDIELLFDESGIHRIHWHWTAGASTPNAKDIHHYNDVFDIEGNQYDGRAPAQHQANYQVGRVGVSHTLNANTGAIGMALCGMGDSEVDWSKGIVDQGKWYLTEVQIRSMIQRSADYCRRYDIPVSIWTTLTHAEVEENIGIRQRGKWDIRALPYEPTKLYSARAAGDILRHLLKKELEC